MTTTRKAYRELLTRNLRSARVFRERLPGNKALRNLARRTVARAWIGTWWPRLADAIARWNNWRALRSWTRCEQCGGRHRARELTLLDDSDELLCGICMMRYAKRPVVERAGSPNDQT